MRYRIRQQPLITRKVILHKNTAILIVDPFNDFLSEGGKLWSKTKDTVNAVNLIQNLKSILSAARSFGIKRIYVPHH